jgi:hypothetical protein
MVRPIEGLFKELRSNSGQCGSNSVLELLPGGSAQGAISDDRPYCDQKSRSVAIVDLFPWNSPLPEAADWSQMGELLLRPHDLLDRPVYPSPLFSRTGDRGGQIGNDRVNEVQYQRIVQIRVRGKHLNLAPNPQIRAI